MTIYPLKRYGQNFLQNKNIAREIVEAIQITPEDTLIEIGPGKGIISRLIIEKAFSRYFAIEIDSRFIDELIPVFQDDKRSQLIIGDIHNFSFEKCYLKGKCRIKVVGNIPYNITSSIIFLLLDNYKFLKDSTLMIQREVAERLMAMPGSKEYGILSILVRTQSKIKLIRHIRPENYFPVPKVDSSVIKLIYYEEIEGINDVGFFRKIVRQSFQTRRKTLKNNLIRFLGRNEVAKLGKISLSRRPEELTINEFKILVNEIENLGI